ncbi:MAG: gliding motility-associated C-terminal domain-containing protein [Bacteroidetes bacterium]|nr:gliding motility-associated C-terminal domain-containing protein [Bacteroidota bacterium]
MKSIFATWILSILFLQMFAQPCQLSNSILLNTAYNPTTLTLLPFGAGDPQWEIDNANNIPGAINNTPAIVCTPNGRGTSYANSRWIGFANPSQYITNNSTVGYYLITYRFKFRTCIDDSLHFNFNISNDNYISALRIDGIVTSFSQPVSLATANWQTFTNFIYHNFFLTGNHTIEVDVQNFNVAGAMNPHMLNIHGNITANSISLVAPNNPPTCICGILPMDSVNAIAAYSYPDNCDSSIIQFTDLSTAYLSTIVNWNWNFGDGFGSSFQNPSHNYLNAGSYLVTLIVTSNTGKIDTFTTTVLAVNNTFSVTGLASPAILCAGNSTTLTGSGAATYSWTGGVTNGIPFTPSSSGLYVVTGTDAAGCSNTATVQITVNPLPLVTANSFPANGQVCAGNSILLFGNGAISYSWTGGVIDGSAFIPLSGSSYTVTGTDANGCSNTASISITVNPLPVVTANANLSNICEGEFVIFIGSGASSYVWTSGVSNGIPFSPLTTTTYTVTGTDANGCTGTSSVPVSVKPAPTVNAVASPSIVCFGNPTTIDANGAVTYVWTGGIIAGQPFVPTATTTYTVTGTDANGCTNTSSVTITVSNNVNVSISPNDPIICLGDSVQLFASGGASYLWSPNTNISQINMPNPYVFPTSSTTYTVIGTDATGCTGTSEVTIDVRVDPKLTVTKSGDAECNQHAIQLNVSGAETYTWSPASILSNANSANPIANINQTTTFIVTGMIGTCVIIDSITVYAYNNDETSIFIPNAFSPNNDGNNDCLHIRNLANFQNFYFGIYNRWGNLVFETDNPEICWDGFYKNEAAPVATYYYFLRGDTKCGKIFKKGDITLLR